MHELEIETKSGLNENQSQLNLDLEEIQTKLFFESFCRAREGGVGNANLAYLNFFWNPIGWLANKLDRIGPPQEGAKISIMFKKLKIHYLLRG
jgi:hypothetical protein